MTDRGLLLSIFYIFSNKTLNLIVTKKCRFTLLELDRWYIDRIF